MKKITLPKKITIPAITIVIIVALFAVLYGANSFFDKYKLVFQSPIQSPVLVQEREQKIISPISVQADQKKNKGGRVVLVPIAEAKEVTEPIFVASSTTEEKVAHYIKEDFGEEHVQSMVNVFQKESGMNPCKINGGAVDCNYQGEKACGLGQALPCSKLRNVCPDLSDVDCQMKYWVGYVKGHGYGTPKEAWRFWLSQVPVKGFGWW